MMRRLSFTFFPFPTPRQRRLRARESSNDFVVNVCLSRGTNERAESDAQEAATDVTIGRVLGPAQKEPPLVHRRG